MAHNDTRQKLIQSGIDVVLAGSFHSAGLQQILSEASVPKGSFYHYFKSKESFGVAIIESSVERQLEWTEGFLNDKQKSPLKRLRAFFDACHECTFKNNFHHECVASKLGSELGEMSEPMRKAIKVGMEQKTSLLTECIREGQEIGEIDTEYAAADLAAFIFNGMEGVRVRMSVDRKLESMEIFISILFDRVLPAR